MADEIERTEEETTEAGTHSDASEGGSDSTDPSQKDTDFEKLYQSEKERADASAKALEAAEALIAKNKKTGKKQKDDGEENADEKPVTQKELAAKIAEALASMKGDDDSAEANNLKKAQEDLKLTLAKNAELARTLKGKGIVKNDATGTHKDGTPSVKPKMSAADEKGMISAGYSFDTVQKVWKKKLGGGKFLYAKDLKSPNWIA